MNDFILTDQQVETLCYSGSLAPSGRNGQPWAVVIDKNKMLIKVRDSEEDVIDVDSLGSVFSIGCFVQNVLTAATKLGLEYSYKLNSPKVGKDFEVEIIFYPGKKNTDAALFNQIKERVTNRSLYFGPAIDNKEITKLEKIAGEFETKMTSLSLNSKKAQIATILSRGDGLRTVNEQLAKQMAKEIRWTQEEVEETRDGLDIETLGMPPIMVQLTKLSLKYPKLNHMVPKEIIDKQTLPLLMASSHLCCLSVVQPISYKKLFVSGMALEKIWLTTTQKNISLHPWTVLTFFNIRARFYKDNIFSKEEREYVKSLGEDLVEAFGLPKNHLPILTFRLTQTQQKVKRSLRLDWRSFTKIL